MIRDVQLLNHLPLFIQEYREIREIMKTENPEFQIVEDETEVIMNNQFITTCNLTGIAKFEKMMGIVPSEEDTLQGRISRVLTRWNDSIPYTFILLCRKLNSLCGQGNYEIIRDINNYKMEIITHLEYSGQAEELDYLLNYMIPANIELTSKNEMMIDINGKTKLASGITFCNVIEISDNFNEEFKINGDSSIKNVIINTTIIEITDNFKEDIKINGNNKVGSTIINTTMIEITDNFKENVKVEGQNNIGSNVNLTEII